MKTHLIYPESGRRRLKPRREEQRHRPGPHLDGDTDGGPERLGAAHLAQPSWLVNRMNSIAHHRLTNPGCALPPAHRAAATKPSPGVAVSAPNETAVADTQAVRRHCRPDLGNARRRDEISTLPRIPSASANAKTMPEAIARNTPSSEMLAIVRIDSSSTRPGALAFLDACLRSRHELNAVPGVNRAVGSERSPSRRASERPAASPSFETPRSSR